MTLGELARRYHNLKNPNSPYDLLSHNAQTEIKSVVARALYVFLELSHDEVEILRKEQIHYKRLELGRVASEKYFQVLEIDVKWEDLSPKQQEGWVQTAQAVLNTLGESSVPS